MPSPFPGMNPYLEQDDVWHDFHERFLPAAAEELAAQLVPDYIVKIDEHVYVHESPDAPRRLIGRADLAVGEVPAPSGGRAGAALIESPATIDLPEVDDVERLAFLEIRDRRSRALVAVVELLSPSNKRGGPDREQYLAKRRQLLAGPAHLVEIDLLRGGQPMPTAEARPPCAYSVTVSRAEDRPRAGFWPIGLRDPLPTIPVPVRGRDATLDLRHLLHRVYDAAGYYYYIYDGRPDPPLGPEDAAWAESLIPGREPNPPHGS